MDDSIKPMNPASNSAQTAPSEETAVFNVGGVTFETYKSTLLRIPNSPLTDSSFLEEHFRPEKKEYFFDKDPDALKIILDFLRTGQLYIPSFIDRLSLRNDLLFCGLGLSGIQQTGIAGPGPDQTTILMDDSITPVDDANTSAHNVSPEGTVVFNVGGVTFETYRSTLLRIPNSPLTNSSFLEEHFRPENKDYFFDKDPDAFKIILDYLRTGQLYIPTFIDRPSLRNDLLFWGLDPNSIQQTGSTGPAQQNVVNSGSTVAFPAETMIVSNTETYRMKIWNILSEPATSMPAKLYAAFAYFLIFVSVYIMVFETTSLFRHKRNDEILNVSGNDTSDVYFEENDTLESDSPIDNHISVYIIALAINLFFTVEYIIRVVVAPNRIQFLFSFLGVIDFLAILPDYALVILSVFVDLNVTMIKILGVFRILRALRVLKHFKTPLNTDVFVSAFKASAGEMVFVSSLIAIGTLASGSVCFFIETGSSSTEYSHFRSIPEACYWAIITLTTVGYGDMRAITPAGRIFSAFTALFGLVMIGLVVSVLVKNFMECSKQTQHRTTCHGVAHEYKNVEEYRPLISSSPVGQNI